MGVTAVEDVSDTDVDARDGSDPSLIGLVGCALLDSNVADAADDSDRLEGSEVTNSTEVSRIVEVIGGGGLFSCRSAKFRASCDPGRKHPSGVMQLGLQYGNARTTLVAARAIDCAMHV